MKKIGVPPEAILPKEEDIDIEKLLYLFEKKEISLICVLGPTASGKTRFAVELARKITYLYNKKHNKTKDFQCEILSADSRQVYRSMDIGSGKDLEDYKGTPYHLIDIVPAGFIYSIYDYQRDFERAYNSILQRGNLPIICGGSGLYIEAASCGYKIAQVPPNYERRKILEEYNSAKLEDIYFELTQKKAIFDSKKRLIRAIEVAYYEKEQNIVYSDISQKKCYFIGTLVDRTERNKKIDERLDKRLQNGMIQEVKSLIESGVSIENLLHYGLEYKFITQYLIGELSYEQMYNSLKIAIHQFAKRQMTYFRGMERDGIKIHWTSKLP